MNYLNQILALMFLSLFLFELEVKFPSLILNARNISYGGAVLAGSCTFCSDLLIESTISDKSFMSCLLNAGF